MFAIFLSEKMDPFYDIILSFPTIFFTLLLALVMLYWLLTVLGLVGIELLDFDIPESGATDSISSLNVFSGLLFKLGLNGVPLTIVLSFIALLGWAISFLVVYFLYPFVPFIWLQFLVGIPVLLGVTYVAAMITATLIKPLRPIFIASNQEVQKHILGQTVVVRSGTVNRQHGEAFLEDGGAGLIIRVRPYKDEIFKRGDRVVLLEYLPGENVYKVMSEVDFNS